MKKNKAAQDLAKRRMITLSPERRKEIATIAAKKRWQKLSTINDLGKYNANGSINKQRRNELKTLRI